MAKRLRVILLLIIAVFFIDMSILLSGCVRETPEQFLIDAGFKQAGYQELKELTTETLIFDYKTSDGRNGTTELIPDGTAKTISSNSSLVGKWLIAQDSLCIHWEGSNEECFKFYHVESGVYELFKMGSDGISRTVITIKK